MFSDIVNDALNKVADLIDSESRGSKAIKAGICTLTGGAIGGGTVAASGLTAVGAVGAGSGIGCAAGPVGVALGATAGLCAYGIKRILS